MWIVEGVRDFDYDVGSLVPPSFEAFARVFHPASRQLRSDEPHEGARQLGILPFAEWHQDVRWATVAKANGRVAHPAMEWASLIGTWDTHRSDDPALWDRSPEEGSLSPGDVASLAVILASHTETPQDCWFGVWIGYGDIGSGDYQGSTLPMSPDRSMMLFSGPVLAATTNFGRDRWMPRSASLWWPRDRAWCVATDVDLRSTYIGASESCVHDIVSSPELEAMRVSADQTLTADTDTINPRPPGSYHH